MTRAQKMTSTGIAARPAEASRLWQGSVTCVQGIVGSSVKYLDRGKFDGKDSAAGLIGDDMDDPFVEGDDAFGHGQAQAEAAGSPCSGAPVEGLEDLGDLFGGDNGALVDDAYEDFVIGKAKIHLRPFVGGIFAAVLHHVLHRDVEQLAVAKDHEILFILREFPKIQFHAVVGAGFFYFADHFHEHLVHAYLV